MFSHECYDADFPASMSTVFMRTDQYQGGWAEDFAGVIKENHGFLYLSRLKEGFLGTPACWGENVMSWLGARGLAEQLKFFAQNPSLDMACTDCIYFGNTELEGRSWQSLDSVEDPVTFDKVLPTHGGAFASFSLLRRPTVLKVGFFDEALRLLQDCHYWLKFLYGGGKMAYIRRVLGKRRVHSESLTYNQDVIIPHAINALRRLLEILDPVGREAVLVRREIALAESKVSVKQGRDQLAMGDYTGAEKAFAKAYAAVPSRKVALALLGLRWFPRLTRRAISRWDRHLAR